MQKYRCDPRLDPIVVGAQVRAIMPDSMKLQYRTEEIVLKR